MPCAPRINCFRRFAHGPVPNRSLSLNSVIVMPVLKSSCVHSNSHLWPTQCGSGVALTSVAPKLRLSRFHAGAPTRCFTSESPAMQFFTRKCCFVGLPMDSTLFLFGRAPKAYTNTKLLNLHMTMWQTENRRQGQTLVHFFARFFISLVGGSTLPALRTRACTNKQS